MICRCGTEVDVPRTERTECPSCRTIFDPPLKIMPPGCFLPILVGGLLISAMSGFVSGARVGLVVLLGMMICGVAMIPVALFRAGMNRRRRARIR